MLSKIFDSVWSKLGERIADKTLNMLNMVPLETLRKNLKLLRDKACDVDEKIKHAERSGQKKRKREVGEWLEEVESIATEVGELGTRMESEGLVKRLMDGVKAAELNVRVEKLVERSQNIGELVIDSFGTRGETLLTARMVGDAFERNLEAIWRFLENEVLSIGIHGMGGVGKTTLAKCIYNRLLQASPGSVFWVTVSQNFTIKSLQDEIGRCLNVGLSDLDNEDRRAGRLYRALSELKNAVIILDDVWRRIDLLKAGCPFSKECCRIIMTTRSLDVCRRIGCEEVIAVQNLGEDEAWNLFNQTFTLGKEIKLSPQVEEIAKSMAKIWDGLPLAIISLAASMRGQTAIHTWRNALDELKKSFADQDGMIEGKVFEVLKYSFDRLHVNGRSQSKDFNLLQLCFLYFSLYPEDEEVEREELIRAFISEGLLDTEKSWMAQFDEGHVIIDKLVNVCLLESVGYDSGGVEYLKMHDLVRGMALKIVGGKYLVRAGELSLTEIPKEDKWTKDVEKVSLLVTNIRRIENGTSPNCPNLSTLILRCSPLDFIPDSFFSKMHGLCHLDLCDTIVRELPESLSNLKNLQALLLARCFCLAYVPYLGNLKALRELDLSDTAIKETPQGVDELLNLKLLSLKAYYLRALPRGVLPKLVNLQYLSLPLHIEADMEEMENLTQLEEFRGRVKNVPDFNCFITSREHDSFYAVQVGGLSGLNLDLSYKQNSKTLFLIECSLEEEKLLGQGIESLTILGCGGMSKCLWDDFSRESRPRNLRMLRISRCRGMECIWRSQQLVSAPQELESPISTLECLDLTELYDLKGLIGTPGPPQGVFLSLRTLIIKFCNKMRKLGVQACGFPNLETFSIEHCGEIEEVFGRGCVTLPKLKKLSLCGLPRLESVCEAAMICNSIEEIFITRCPRLVKKLPVRLGVPLQPTLKYVNVDREWWESLEWDNPHQLPHLLQSSVCRIIEFSGSITVVGLDDQSSSGHGDIGSNTAVELDEQSSSGHGDIGSNTADELDEQSSSDIGSNTADELDEQSSSGHGDIGSNTADELDEQSSNGEESSDDEDDWGATLRLGWIS